MSPARLTEEQSRKGLAVLMERSDDLKDIQKFQQGVMDRLEEKRAMLIAKKTELKESLKEVDENLADLEKHLSAVNKKFDNLRKKEEEAKQQEEDLKRYLDESGLTKTKKARKKNQVTEAELADDVSSNQQEGTDD